MKKKKPLDSAVLSREFIMPNQLNNKNTLFGGALVSLIDKVASMAAQKHSKGDVVTASIDSLSFNNPVYKNDHLILKAMVNFSGTTSMEVGVRIETENPKTGDLTHISTAYLTFVAVDENSRPRKVPKIYPTNEEEKRRFKNAQTRREARLSLRDKIQSKK